VVTQNTGGDATVARPPIHTSQTRKYVLARLVPMLFGALLVGLVFAELRSAADVPTGPAPRSLAGLTLAQVVTGPDAVYQMSRLHGKGIGVLDGYIAHYRGATGGAVLYVGEMGSVESAVAFNRQMVDLIAAGNPMFTDLRSLAVENIEVFEVRSGPETHYFWQVGELINWIGFDRDDRDALAAAVRAIR
jgi:hypothetical protein